MRFLAVFLLLQGGCFAQELSIFTNDNPPLQYLDKDYHVQGGVGVDIVRAIQKAIGDTSPIVGIPWARGYTLALKQKDVMLFATTRTPERETLFKWVGPLFESRSVLVASKTSDLALNSVDDAKRLKSIGVVRDDVRGQILKAMGFTNLEETTNYLNNIRKYAAGRVQAFTSTNVLMAAQIREAGFLPADFRIVFTYSKNLVYLAFSTLTPDETIAKWSAGLETIKHNGTLARLLQDIPLE